MSKVMEPSIEGPVAPPKLVHAIRLSLQEASCSGETTENKLKTRNREGDPLSSKEKAVLHTGKRLQTLLHTLRKKILTTNGKLACYCYVSCYLNLVIKKDLYKN